MRSPSRWLAGPVRAYRTSAAGIAQSSRPETPSSRPVKKLAPTRVNSPGEEGAAPGFRSKRGCVPAAVPSLVQGSRPERPSAAAKRRRLPSAAASDCGAARSGAQVGDQSRRGAVAARDPELRAGRLVVDGNEELVSGGGEAARPGRVSGVRQVADPAGAARLAVGLPERIPRGVGSAQQKIGLAVERDEVARVGARRARLEVGNPAGACCRAVGEPELAPVEPVVGGHQHPARKGRRSSGSEPRPVSKGPRLTQSIALQRGSGRRRRLMSRTMRVPAAVPSETQSSLPKRGFGTREDGSGPRADVVVGRAERGGRRVVGQFDPGRSRIISSIVHRRSVTPATWQGVLPFRVMCGRQKL